MRPHRGPRGVQLVYADGSRRFVPRTGALTVGEATKLLKTYDMAIYRLMGQKKISVRNGDQGFLARISVASLAALKG